MNTLTPWLEVTITGFIYLCSIVFIMLSIAKKRDVNTVHIFKEYLPYVSVIILFLSYVIGLSAYLIVQNVIFYFIPSVGYEPAIISSIQEAITEKQYRSFENGYATLVMLRHLVISYAFFAISFFVWLNASTFIQWRKAFLIFSIILEIIFVLAYCSQRSHFQVLKESLIK